VKRNVMEMDRAAERRIEQHRQAQDLLMNAQQQEHDRQQAILRQQAGAAAVVGIEICLLLLNGT